jgi:N-acetyl-1-D-myo-inositol-2-amino-2-deoxy-alpha-D-glucopyranoside deacetylase
MERQRTLVLVGAHPDDETFGMGAALAHYVQKGYKVYYVCATRGEAGEAGPEYLQGYQTIGELRTAELKCAEKTLGLTGVIFLGYRDSGMAGSEDNKNPQAFINAPLEQATGRVVKILRELKPEVVVTSDPAGGYGHPDHIMAHKVTLKAFHAAGDAVQYKDAGPVFQPQKLYYSIFPHGFMRFMVKLMPLFGQNPHKFGKNKDIDLASMVAVEYPINAAVKLSKQDMAIRDKASACHASQGGGRPRRRGWFGFVRSISGQRDYFMRAYPPVTSKKKESDLFQRI